jgi:urea carboxylase
MNPSRPFTKVLIANRGAIACRIIRTLRRMGVGSVAVYSEADRHSLHVSQADESVCIGPAPASQSYLSVDAILAAARATGADAIHPGYGFLSENAAFAEACAASGIVFIGPEPAHMRAFGLKHTAREIAQANAVPILPGTDLLADSEQAVQAAAAIGYPVMLKSTAGGGGIGMRLAASEPELREAFDAVHRLSIANFGHAGLYLEKFVAAARHIEVQVFGDGLGTVVALGERDCSVQRRNQKVIEETPAPGLTPEVRAALLDTAVRMCRAVNYKSAGTVEFIYDQATAQFYFLEVNTRLQVEHGVTEEVTGVDLVEWMVRVAAGEPIPLAQSDIRAEGWSIQARIYAEDPGRNFRPCAGRLVHVAWPASARVETWVESGTEVTPFYDPMLAKVIVKGRDRAEALALLSDALAQCEISGIETVVGYLGQVVQSDAFRAGGVTTAFLRDFPFVRRAVDVLEGGTQTTVQDWPGRLGYWHVGVPPSGPMDAASFRLANRLCGNPEGAPGLEITVLGPTLQFASETAVVLGGADFGATLDGAPLPLWQPVAVPAGGILKLGSSQGPGARAYLAIAGGIEAPEYLGSRSTFILGGFGGPFGRTLRAGDVLHLGPPAQEPPSGAFVAPLMTSDWEIGVLYGPHGAPDFFLDEDIETFFTASWKVHYNSDRTGVRLVGPKPKWARKDGGEAGLHPSNIHDNAYAIGAVDFTGDMPVILGPDGPSLGGFVCPATIIESELWKMGQLKPGDTLRFRRVSPEPAVLAEKPQAPAMICRAQGDRNLLVEFGPNVLDMNLRFRVHSLEQGIRSAQLPGIVDITPGIRSLQIHYDARLHRQDLLAAVADCERRIPDLDEITVPSRIVHLPLSWDDPATQLAIRKYMQGVRPDAPWCPSNIEFIRRVNGLGTIDDVHRIVFDASYLVLGLGDVYLGAPVATPVDPRHRLVTTKYNPARTWTPENAVGIGGAYLCVYGMEGPGGYQFVGRTVQMWNTFRSTREFQPGTPWLLRFFDQIRFYPVGAEELLEIRESFPRGGYPLRIEETSFGLRGYHEFLANIATDSQDFKRRQQAAFDAERERWAASGQAEIAEPPDSGPQSGGGEEQLPEGWVAARSPATASVWKILVEDGQPVEAGQQVVILEAMKMEIAVTSPVAGTVRRILCATGAMVVAGQALVAVEGNGR